LNNGYTEHIHNENLQTSMQPFILQGTCDLACKLTQLISITVGYSCPTNIRDKALMIQCCPCSAGASKWYKAFFSRIIAHGLVPSLKQSVTSTETSCEAWRTSGTLIPFAFLFPALRVGCTPAFAHSCQCGTCRSGKC